MSKKEFLDKISKFEERALSGRHSDRIIWAWEDQKNYMNALWINCILDKELTATERKILSDRIAEVMYDWDLLRSSNADKIDEHFLED